MTMLPIGKEKEIVIVIVKTKKLQTMRPHNLRCNRNKIRSLLVSFARKVDM